MELSVTVRGLAGGEDLRIHIALALTQREGLSVASDEPNWFTASELGSWASEHAPNSSRDQGVVLFNCLFRAANRRDIELAWKCSRNQDCRGRSCRGVHYLTGFGYGVLDEDVLRSVNGIGGKRLELALAYRDWWNAKLPFAYRVR